MPGFDWNSANIEHIARHNLVPEQVEQVIQNNPIDSAPYFRNGEERLDQVGETDEGLVLVVVTTVRKGKIRVVLLTRQTEPCAGSTRTRERHNMPKTKEAPQFRSEEEEANWLDSAKGQAEMLNRFQQAKQEGTLGRGTLKKRGLTPPITIRLDPVDVELARVQAEERGLKYQTYLKMVIHQALRKAALKSRKLEGRTT